MVNMHQVEGYENFVEFFKNFDAKGTKIHVYFSGSKLPNGTSWCDDCRRAWPVIKEELEKFDKTNPDTHFVYVEVGDRPFWKDPKCPFRTDPSTKLMVLPTLIRWHQPQRLNGDQCEKNELVQMLFEDDEEF
ncbi:unnamed protein product [Phyllotreta striolata]|uniref:Thioredoxin domain-containing protein 17 n=1 Tax=Phyllotreta striolata TaxID=444603 RepID=A0A9N9XTS8_PHYSR|nr:unnamed protein product [Phyllotreta striolata]